MLIQAGMIDLESKNPSAKGGDTSTFDQVTFPHPFPPNSTVAVFITMQTFVGGETPGLRVADVTPTGFKIRENEMVIAGHPELSNGTHLKEKVAWLAMVV